MEGTKSREKERGTAKCKTLTYSTRWRVALMVERVCYSKESIFLWVQSEKLQLVLFVLLATAILHPINIFSVPRYLIQILNIAYKLMLVDKNIRLGLAGVVVVVVDLGLEFQPVDKHNCSMVADLHYCSQLAFDR